MKQEIQTSYGRLANMPIENVAQLEVVQEATSTTAKRKCRVITDQVIRDLVLAHAGDNFADDDPRDSNELVAVNMQELDAVIRNAIKYINNEE